MRLSLFIKHGHGKADKKNKFVFWGFIILTFLLCLTYTYSDPIITQGHGIALWDSLFNGDFLNYYQYCAENTQDIPVYDVTIYFIFAIWNFPCWIYKCFTGVRAQDSLLCVVYGKLLMYVGFILLLYTILKLCKSIQKNRGGEQTLAYSITKHCACSGILLLYIVYSGNYDVWSLIFIVAGLEFLVSGKNKKFLIMFAIATSMKYFAAWIFIPILLLKEKRVLRVFAGIVSCFSLSVIEDLLFHKNLFFSTYARNGLSDWNTSNQLSAIAGGGAIDLGIGTVSACFVLYALLCIWCYLQNDDSGSESFIYKSLYVSLAAWFIFFVFIQFNSYWLVLIVPFLSIITLYDEKNAFLKVILESIITYCLIFGCLIRQSWVVGGEVGVAAHGLLNRIVELEGLKTGKIYTFGALLKYYNEQYGFSTYLCSAVIACSVALLVITRPVKIDDDILRGVDSSNDAHVAIMCRNVFGLVLFVVPTIVYLGQVLVYNH